MSVDFQKLMEDVEEEESASAIWFQAKDPSSRNWVVVVADQREPITRFRIAYEFFDEDQSIRYEELAEDPDYVEALRFITEQLFFKE